MEVDAASNKAADAEAKQPKQSKARENDFAISLSPLVHRVCWSTLLGFHTTCAIFLALASYCYWLLPNTKVGVSFDASAIGIGMRHAHVVSGVAGAIAALHALIGISMVALSLMFRRFTYTIPDEQVLQLMGQSSFTSQHFSSSFIKRIRRTSSKNRRTKVTWMTSLIQQFIRQLHATFGRRGLLGIEGKHFMSIFLARELFGIALKTFQAYRLAAIVPRTQLVRGFVSLLVFNCWSTPLIHRFIPMRPGAERLVCLLVNVALDFASTILIPAALVVPYVKEYNPVTTNFPQSRFMDSTWEGMMRSDFNLVLVSSWPDLLSRVILSLGILSMILDTRSLLYARPAKPGSVRSSGEKFDAAGKIADAVTTASSDTVQVPTFKQTQQKAAPVTPRSHRIMQIIIVAWGVVVLAVHIAAESRGHIVGCVLPVLPWQSSHPGCAYFAFNCVTSKTNGAKDDVGAAFARLDTKSLQQLEIRVCPAFYMPHQVQQFDQLRSIKFIASNVVEWTADAAVTAKYHPYLSTFAAFKTTMPGSEVPQGLLTAPFPPSLRIINFQNSDLATLPPTVPAIWPKGLILFLEHCNFTVVPDVMTRLVTPVLSFAGNHFTTFPPSIFYTPAVQVLDLSSNPTATLPEIPAPLIAQRGPPARTVTLLDVTDTLLDGLPTWITTKSTFRVLAAGTPLCARVARANFTPGKEALERTVDCVSRRHGT